MPANIEKRTFQAALIHLLETEYWILRVWGHNNECRIKRIGCAGEEFVLFLIGCRVLGAEGTALGG